MAEAPDPRDLQLLGIGPAATSTELHRAYQRARALWADDSLATYGLMEPAEREAMLARLEAAYQRLIRRLGSGPTPVAARTGHAAPEPPVPPPASVPEEPTAAPPPPPADDPGALLRQRREAAGIGLDAVARETRIRRAVLEALEEGRRSMLPAPVYIRGFVIAYAEAVGMADPQEVARRYLAWIEHRGR